MSTLLEKADALPVRSKRTNQATRPSDDQMELALAWLDGQVGIMQVCAVLGITHESQAYVKMSLWIREAYQRDFLIRTW